MSLLILYSQGPAAVVVAGKALTRMGFRQRILDDYGHSPPPWISDRWLNLQIERAKRELSKFCTPVQGSCSFNAVANQRTYPLTSDFIEVNRVEIGTDKRELERTTLNGVAYTYGTEWRTEMGTLSEWYREDMRRLGFYPLPATAGSAIYVYGPRYYAEFTDDTTAGEVGTALEDAVVSRVCEQMALRDKRDEAKPKRKIFRDKYRERIERYQTARQRYGMVQPWTLNARRDPVRH